MKQTIKKVKLLCTAIVALSLACASVVTSYAEDEKINVVCVGDSLTRSYGATSGNTYPEKLEEYLNKNGELYEVLNCGKSGATLFSGRSGYIGTPQYKRSVSVVPDLVVIMLGTNDLHSKMFESEIDTSLYKSNYKRLIDTYRNLNENVKIIMMSPPPVDIDSTSPLGTSSNPKINSFVAPLVEELADAYGCEYLNIYAAVDEAYPQVPDGELDETMWCDGLHFTDKGYEMIAGFVYDKIKNLENENIVSADFISNSELSVIPDKNISGDIYIATYDSEKRLVSAVVKKTQNLVGGISNVIDVTGLNMTDVTSVKAFYWNEELTPLADFSKVGERLVQTGTSVVITGTNPYGKNRDHAILIKDANENVVYAAQTKSDANGVYSYTFTPAEGVLTSYTIYTEGMETPIIENVIVE